MLRSKYLYLVAGAMLSLYCFNSPKPNSQNNARSECIAVYRKCRNAMRRSLPLRLVYQKVSYYSNAT